MLACEISTLGKLELENLCYGRCNDTSDAQKLILLSGVNKNCLTEGLKTCKGTTPSLRSKYEQLVNTYTLKCPSDDNCKDEVLVIEDKSIEYFKKNPSCCTYDKWKKIALGICEEVGLSIIVEEQKRCDIAFELNIETIPTKCLAPLFIVERLEKCDDIDFKIIARTKEQCEIDFKLLLEQVSNCDLSFEQYYKLNKKGLSFDALREIYNSALAVRLHNGKVQLIGKINTYEVGKDIKFDSNISIREIDSRLEYLNKITEDLNLPKDIIEELYS